MNWLEVSEYDARLYLQQLKSIIDTRAKFNVGHKANSAYKEFGERMVNIKYIPKPKTEPTDYFTAAEIKEMDRLRKY